MRHFQKLARLHADEGTNEVTASYVEQPVVPPEVNNQYQ